MISSNQLLITILIGVCVTGQAAYDGYECSSGF